MFGMGFAEILIIGVIAILFLGPDKLPETMIEIAKFFKNVKRTVASAKESLEQEMHIADIKEEAQSYKKELTSASGELERLSSLGDINAGVDDLLGDAKVDMKESESSKPEPAPASKAEVVTFEKKGKPAEPKEENS